jgi:hypothetical protein
MAFVFLYVIKKANLHIFCLIDIIFKNYLQIKSTFSFIYTFFTGRFTSGYRPRKLHRG